MASRPRDREQAVGAKMTPQHHSQFAADVNAFLAQDD